MFGLNLIIARYWMPHTLKRADWSGVCIGCDDEFLICSKVSLGLDQEAVGAREGVRGDPLRRLKMLHVSHTDSSTHTLITVEGHLAGEGVPLVSQYCLERLADDRPLVLYLKNVTEVDQGGRALLRQLIVRGVRLRASGIYTEHLVEDLKRECEPGIRPRSGHELHDNKTTC